MQNDPTEQQRGSETGNGNPPPSRQQQPVPTEKDPVDKPAEKK
jgi:hypothetical protein